jgi:hypothetical protein
MSAWQIVATGEAVGLLILGFCLYASLRAAAHERSDLLNRIQASGLAEYAALTPIIQGATPIPVTAEPPEPESFAPVVDQAELVAARVAFESGME